MAKEHQNTNLKKPSKLFGFFYNYWITVILLLVFLTLIYQSFFINNFPNILINKQQIIDKRILVNKELDAKNQTLIIENTSKYNIETLESIARYRFGMVKDGEKYYQISETAPNGK